MFCCSQDEALLLVRAYVHEGSNNPYGFVIDFNRDQSARPIINMNNQRFRRSMPLRPENIFAEIAYQGKLYLLLRVTVKEVSPTVASPSFCPKLDVVKVQGIATKHSEKSASAATKLVWKDCVFTARIAARTRHADAEWMWRHHKPCGALDARGFEALCDRFPRWATHADPDKLDRGNPLGGLDSAYPCLGTKASADPDDDEAAQSGEARSDGDESSEHGGDDDDDKAVSGVQV